MPTQSRRRLDWAAHRSKIEDLYWNHGGKLREVMETMAAVHGFVATQKMYKKHFKAWGLEKNIKTRESMFMIAVAEQRRMANKETLFIRHGKPVDLRKLYRFKRRHKLDEDEGSGLLRDAQMTTPPHITYRTPEPEELASSLPPAPDPCHEPDTSEGEQPAVADSPASYGFNSEGTPPTVDNPWEHPFPTSFPSDEAFSVSHRPTHPSMIAHFIPDAFSAHQMPIHTHDPSRQNPGHTLSYTPWVDPTDPPYHGYHPFVDGNFPCLFDPQPLEQAPHMSNWLSDRGVAVFSAQYSPDLNHALLDINAFTNPIPSLTLRGSPETAWNTRDQNPLVNAVDQNDLARVRALLAGGANPSCAACSGMTALRQARGQAGSSRPCQPYCYLVCRAE